LVHARAQAIAPYKNRAAASDAEAEYVENLFDALCCTLMSPEHRQLFVEAEGVELMVLILRQRRPVRAGALKALVRF
jgi:beta-catenin-like protein 1